MQTTYVYNKCLRKLMCLVMILIILISLPFEVISGRYQTIQDQEQEQSAIRDSISAKSASLVDVSSGRVLFAKNEHAVLPMASTTKVMTAILALEKGDPKEIVTASAKASQVEGSSIYLEHGEQLDLNDMLFGLMLDSGNDAAHAIAEHISGSVESFAAEMTKKAHNLGAENTKFKNPHGLPNDGHYSTAHDMTVIARYGLKNKIFKEIVSTKEKQIPWKAKEETDWRNLVNDNKLLENIEYADGVKTGWTEKAGRCLIFSATKDNRQIVGTVLNAPEMYKDADLLLDYGFKNYTEYNLLQSGQLIRMFPVKDGVINEIPIISSNDITIPLSYEEFNNFNYIVKINQELKAPLEKHEQVGSLKIVAKGQIVAKTAIITAKEVEKPFYRKFIPLKLFYGINV